MAWFLSWFDSPYYHILYQNRDEAEAQLFIDHLLGHLQLEKGSKILDLACGKGRHSIYMSEKGYDVLGVDLSPESILFAQQFEHEHLKFQVQDMREQIQGLKFDAVFNLFTSFGYFNSEEEHLSVLKSIKGELKEDGILVIDFMNAYRVIQNLFLEEIKIVAGIEFNINRYVENSYIVKEIRFSDKGQDYFFKEMVRGFQLDDFLNLFEKSGFKLLHSFGNYNLEEFEHQTSDRLILVAVAC
jgi:cyclopropane fatty-acyl-phospholipid synthase-like methyltransferase